MRAQENSGPAPGGEVAYTEADDIDQTRLDAGQGLAGLPGSILRMTGDPLQVVDPKNLPVDPATCKPIEPSQYLEVNTIFNVTRDHGLRTAWSEVQAILNEINGFDHSGKTRVGVPAIFGMNFQAVSTAQKLPASDGLAGGYLPGGRVPGPLLVRALGYVDAKIGAMIARIRADGLAGSTAIIVSAKHGQSPTDPAGPGPGARLAGHRRDQRRLEGGAPGRGRSRCLLDR